MAESRIEWTRFTWNPWYGCTKVSPACDHCYAERWGRRTGLMTKWGGPRRLASEATRDAPYKWNQLAADGQRFRVFTLSLGDFFDNRINAAWRADAWDVIRHCQNLDWLILTKRPQNIFKMLPPDWGGKGYPHVWLGATTENRLEATRRIRYLLRVPAPIHWVSAEPLLESLDLRNNLAPAGQLGINWVVGGGESGGKERQTDPDWFRDLRDQCQATGAAYFMKQMTKKAAIPLDLLVRQYPQMKGET